MPRWFALDPMVIDRLRLMLLALVLVVPGVAQAAGSCPHEIARAVSTEAPTAASECHETAKPVVKQGDAGHDQGKQKRSCCAAGTSCAGAQAMLSSTESSRPMTVTISPKPGLLPSYASRTLLPDYPPPRA